MHTHVLYNYLFHGRKSIIAVGDQFIAYHAIKVYSC